MWSGSNVGSFDQCRPTGKVYVAGKYLKYFKNWKKKHDILYNKVSSLPANITLRDSIVGGFL